MEMTPVTPWPTFDFILVPAAAEYVYCLLIIDKIQM